jgi:hypothetical protein
MLLGTFHKQPADRYDFDFNYGDWLTVQDNLEGSTVTVLPDDSADLDGLQIESVTVIDPILKLWISGGKNRTTYKITLTSTTADGRVKQDEIKLKVKDI